MAGAIIDLAIDAVVEALGIDAPEESIAAAKQAAKAAATAAQQRAGPQASKAIAHHAAKADEKGEAKPATATQECLLKPGQKDPNHKRPRKKPKPRQPNKKKWVARGGKIIEHPDGSTTYVNDKGQSITYNKDGYPDFSDHSVLETKSDELTGDNYKDKKLVNESFGFSNTPDGYRWHHVEDGTTMQLVPEDLHDEFYHTGGASVLRGNK